MRGRIKARGAGVLRMGDFSVGVFDDCDEPIVGVENAGRRGQCNGVVLCGM